MVIYIWGIQIVMDSLLVLIPSKFNHLPTVLVSIGIVFFMTKNNEDQWLGD